MAGNVSWEKSDKTYAKHGDRLLVGADRLLLWEFGGRPIVYYWEASDISKMKALYDEFMQLRHLQGVEMLEHLRFGGGLVRVAYANGEKMYFNYDPTRTQTCDGVTLSPLSWRLVK